MSKEPRIARNTLHIREIQGSMRRRNEPKRVLRSSGFRPSAAWRSPVMWVGLCWAAACESPGQPSNPAPTPFVVSNPVASVAYSEASPPTTGGAAGGEVAYLSLPPGAIPNGVEARITVTRSATIVTATMVSGGFDPVAVPASAGDTLAIDIRMSGSANPVRYVVTVPVRAPPIVVRTNPPPHKRDVPLNAVMVIVFSEPIAIGTANSGSVQLWRDTTPVGGTVRFGDVSHLMVEFEPDGLLLAQTEYRLVVTQGIRDVNRVAFTAPLEVRFTTGAGEAAGAAAKLAFMTEPVDATTGVALTRAVVVAVQDAFGNTVNGATDVVTLSLGEHPTGGTLAGDLTSGAVNGVATFTNVSFGQAGTYTLAATTGTLTGATSARFTVRDGGSFLSVTSGGAHTCGVTDAGTAYCWGLNDHGQLGDGTTSERTAPVLVAGGHFFSSLRLGGAHTCGLTSNGTTYCWGSNDHGQLGDGSTTDRTVPVPVAGELQFLYGLTLGESHTCGSVPVPLDPDEGVVYCWGQNGSGQLGDGTTGDRTTPLAVAGGPSISVVSAGGQHTCGLDLYGMGFAYCWGSNSNGQLDVGTTAGSLSPVRIILIGCGFGPPTPGGPSCPLGAVTPFENVTAGGAHTCAEAGGSYYLSFAWYCWGGNGDGQLGEGTTTDRTAPVLVGGGRSFIAMSAGASHTCGIAGHGDLSIPGFWVTDGSAYCWGLNDHGQLGDGTTTTRTSPVPVAGGVRFLSLSAGSSHTCGVSALGVYCWGNNDHGQLGSGTTSDSAVPVKVVGQP